MTVTGWFAGKSGTKSPSNEGLCFYACVNRISVVDITSLKDLASRITPAASLLNSSVEINRSLDGDDAYVMLTMFT